MPPGSEEKKYKCNLCDKSYKNMKSMRMHMSTKHNRRAFAADASEEKENIDERNALGRDKDMLAYVKQEAFENDADKDVRDSEDPGQIAATPRLASSVTESPKIPQAPGEENREVVMMRRELAAVRSQVQELEKVKNEQATVLREMKQDIWMLKNSLWAIAKDPAQGK